MRQALAIVLVVVHLLGNTETGQLFKLTNLITHYFQHHRLDNSLSFLDFLENHYSGDDGTTSDDDMDQKLPFRHLNPNTLFGVYAPMVSELSVTDNQHLQSTKYGNLQRQKVPSEHVLLIFQPPRLA
jgi:hypothetical protein